MFEDSPNVLKKKTLVRNLEEFLRAAYSLVYNDQFLYGASM